MSGPAFHFNLGVKPVSSRRDLLVSQLGPFVAIPIRVLERVHDAAAVQLYCWLSRYANQERVAWPGQKRLADDMGCSVRTMQRALEVLKDQKVVETISTRVHGVITGVEYRLLFIEPLPDHTPRVALGDTTKTTEQHDTRVIPSIELDPELDPSTTAVVQTGYHGSEQYRKDLADAKKPSKRRRKPSRHDGHPFCGSAFCVDAEKHAKFTHRLRAAGGDPDEYDLPGMYKDWDAEFEGAGTTDHPAFYLEKRFAAALRDEFGNQPSA